jgi:hypothetical protein
MKERSGRIAWAGAVLSLTMAVPVFAQSPKLKGITAVQLIAEDMDETDASCGLTDATFRNAVAEPVTNAKIRVVSEGAADVYLYVRTSSLYFDSTDVCVTSWAVDLRGFVEWQAEPSAEASTAPAILQSKGGLLSSSRSVHSSRVNEAAREAAKEIVQAIRLANQ